MERLQTASIISFIEEFDKKGSWCAETHLQKSMYFLQHLDDVPTGFNFILYKHGPFSFDFRQAVEKYSGQMEFVSGYPGEKNVAELERMGAALLVTLKTGEKDQRMRAQEIDRLKPHIPLDVAIAAVQQVDDMKKEFQHTFDTEIK